MVVYAPAQIISAPAQLITAPAQLITAPAQPPATGAVVYDTVKITGKFVTRLSFWHFWAVNTHYVATANIGKSS